MMPPTAAQLTHLDRDFLPIRAKILEIAAAMDRIQRAGEQKAEGERWKQLQAGVRLLLAEEPERAEQVQLLFSRPYDRQWRETMDVTR